MNSQPRNETTPAVVTSRPAIQIADHHTPGDRFDILQTAGAQPVTGRVDSPRRRGQAQRHIRSETPGLRQCQGRRHRVTGAAIIQRTEVRRLHLDEPTVQHCDGRLAGAGDENIARA